MDMVSQMDSDPHWTVGSPKAWGYVTRMAFAFFLWWLAGTLSVAIDLLHLPSLFGSVVTGRTGLLHLAWICTIISIFMVPLLARLQRSNLHTRSN